MSDRQPTCLIQYPGAAASFVTDHAATIEEARQRGAQVTELAFDGQETIYESHWPPTSPPPVPPGFRFGPVKTGLYHLNAWSDYKGTFCALSDEGTIAAFAIGAALPPGWTPFGARGILRVMEHPALRGDEEDAEEQLWEGA